MRRVVSVGVAAALAALAGCNNQPAFPDVPASGPAIVIEQFAYVPSTLSVPPGATVVVVNQDAEQHSVTSEAAAGTYAPGAVAGVSFDTGVFGKGVRLITIPADAPVGTVIPYFCQVHGGAMSPPDGAITVVAAASDRRTPPPGR